MRPDQFLFLSCLPIFASNTSSFCLVLPLLRSWPKAGARARPIEPDSRRSTQTAEEPICFSRCEGLWGCRSQTTVQEGGRGCARRHSQNSAELVVDSGCKREVRGRGSGVVGEDKGGRW